MTILYHRALAVRDDADEVLVPVVAHLKRHGRPQYLDAVTADNKTSEEVEVPEMLDEEDVGFASLDIYGQAVSIVLRHKKAATSYIQRLQIGYNRSLDHGAYGEGWARQTCKPCRQAGQSPR